MSKQLFLPLFILVIIAIMSCDNNPNKASQDKAKSDIESPLNNELLTEMITAFYIQRYIGGEADYSVRGIQLVNIEAVPVAYVDSIKSDLYQNGMLRIRDNMDVRQNMIDQLVAKLEKYKNEGQKDKLESLQNSIERLEKRNQIQQAEIQDLRSRDSIVQARQSLMDNSSKKFYQVDFAIKDQLDQLVRLDTSSLIFSNTHQIEDLLNDRPWKVD